MFLPQHKVYGQGFVRLHAPWQVLSREAEFLKIKVPTKKVCHFCSFFSGAAYLHRAFLHTVLECGFSDHTGVCTGVL